MNNLISRKKLNEKANSKFPFYDNGYNNSTKYYIINVMLS